MTMSRRTALLLLAWASLLSPPASIAQTEEAPRVKFSTSAGDFVVELYPDKAPKTVENFLQYVRDKHYDGTIFHRVIENFMVQGGGFDAKFSEKKTRAPVVHEGRDALAKGGLRNVVGTLAMFLVGGGIVVHGFAPLAEFSHHLAGAVGAIPGAALIPLLFDAAVGTLTGAVVLACVLAGSRLRRFARGPVAQ